MYEELLIGLSGHAKRRGCDDRCPYYNAGSRGYETCSEELAEKAADAIEELIFTAESYKRSMEAWADVAANAQASWIPVTERLPKPNTRIIAYMAWKQIITLEYQNSRWYLADRLGSIPDEAVTHWMPLPEPPKEEA